MKICSLAIGYATTWRIEACSNIITLFKSQERNYVNPCLSAYVKLVNTNIYVRTYQ